MTNRKIKKSPIDLLPSTLMLALLGSAYTEVHAALSADATLAFEPGQAVCVIGGTPPNCDFYAQDVTGTYFAMDFDGSGIFTTNEKTPLAMMEGVRLGDVQPALGGHGGPPDGSELPSINVPWLFFGILECTRLHPRRYC